MHRQFLAHLCITNARIKKTDTSKNGAGNAEPSAASTSWRFKFCSLNPML